ncbi:Gamma carbonic anhydrase-like 1 protein [Thalictrum thalictroides]|uniref:Gamma carbonic anhydrase-like 1 protein n=1 Tax=Thalictrum thalictroides TaxID=46969 RepID=A0A7J6X9T7_THATH|nr:Gamma carbonic anhydrase-like 1 protein [Thalictrum thalictroides]
MDSGRKRKGSSFMKGKLVMFYRTPEKPTTSVQYNTSKVKPSPPPSTTTVGYLVDQEFLVPASNKKVSFVKSSDHGICTRETKGYGIYGGGGGAAGQVTVCDGSSVWNGSVLRGDLNKITIGFCSNVQERSVLHAAWASPTGLPAETSIERFVTIGAYCLLRSCTIEPECIIGQHSILMEGSLVETNSILEAGSVVPPGRRIPTGELWAGNPARYVRSLTHEEILEIPKLAVAINDLSKSYFNEFLPYSTVYLEVEKLKKSFGIPI